MMSDDVGSDDLRSDDVRWLTSVVMQIPCATSSDASSDNELVGDLAECTDEDIAGDAVAVVPRRRRPVPSRGPAVLILIIAAATGWQRHGPCRGKRVNPSTSYSSVAKTWTMSARATVSPRCFRVVKLKPCFKLLLQSS